MAEIAEHRDAPPQDALRAAFWVLGTAFSFILMMIAIRQLSTSMSSFELLSFRSLLGIPRVCAVAWHMGFRQVRTRRAGMQIGRNVVHFGGQWCWVIGLTLLPMAHVTALEFTMPIWTVVIAMLVLGERAKSHRIIATLMGLAGVLLILRPGIEIVTDGASALYGSDAVADWPILNALLNTASGASWVSFHHGGGVGIGNSLHAGQVLVADGSPEMAVRIERVLTNDPGIGVVRHVDAGYEIAVDTARREGLKIPMLDR